MGFWRVLGCGSIGRRHLRLLNELPEVTVWACDRDPEIMADALAEAPADLAPRVDLLAAAPALRSLDPSLPLPWASRRFRSADCR